jgi:hypothetical protein
MCARHRTLAATFVGLTATLSLGCGGDSTEPIAQTTGAIEVSVSTVSTDIDVDPNGYTLNIDGRLGPTVGVNAMLSIGTLLPGAHFIQLDDLAPNCSVRGPNPLPVYVFSGKAPQTVTFLVGCSAKDGSGGGDWDY